MSHDEGCQKRDMGGMVERRSVFNERLQSFDELRREGLKRQRRQLGPDGA